MLKSSFSLKAIVSVIGLTALIFLTYLSVLGVNNSVQSNMKNYFQNISSNNYSKVLESYSKNSQLAQKSFNESMEFHFSLELALLEYFDLLNSSGYRIEINRENMWLPLFTPNELNVSVSFQKQNNSSFFPRFFSGEKHKKLMNFLTVVREDEKWKIREINIVGSDLESIYKRIQSSLESDKYVQLTQDGFILKRSNIDLQQIAPLERRVLIHNLKTALESIKNKTTH